MNRIQFLSQLLRKENSVQASEGQECMICKEEYGTSWAEIETVERQIRLPCNSNHTVGSDCIATWLQAHNTCPVCRYEFFPAEKREAERSEALYIDFLVDDASDEGDDTDDDEDFVDEGGETNEEDENMSDEDEITSDDDSQDGDGDDEERRGVEGLRWRRP